MTLLSIILFILGIGFLILGWRWQSPQDTELLAALKGLVHLKRELEKVQGNLERLEMKVRSLPMNSVDADGALKDIISEVVKASQTAWPGEPLKPGEPQRPRRVTRVAAETNFDQVSVGFESERGVYSWEQRADGNRLEREPEDEKTAWPQDGSSLRRNEEIQHQPLPEKYLKVLELADSGLSLKEIARELSLSQDAVDLVLRTAPRGGRA